MSNTKKTYGRRRKLGTMVEPPLQQLASLEEVKVVDDDEMEFSDKDEQNDMMSSMRKLDLKDSSVNAPNKRNRNPLPGPLSVT